MAICLTTGTRPKPLFVFATFPEHDGGARDEQAAGSCDTRQGGTHHPVVGWGEGGMRFAPTVQPTSITGYFTAALQLLASVAVCYYDVQPPLASLPRECFVHTTFHTPCAAVPAQQWPSISQCPASFPRGRDEPRSQLQHIPDKACAKEYSIADRAVTPGDRSHGEICYSLHPENGTYSFRRTLHGRKSYDSSTRATRTINLFD